MIKPQIGLGPHLILDLYDCETNKIMDKVLIHKILDELPAQIGMHKMKGGY